MLEERQMLKIGSGRFGCRLPVEKPSKVTELAAVDQCDAAEGERTVKR